MIDYIKNIKNKKLSIYDKVDTNDKNLYIPTNCLEKILKENLTGLSLANLPLRTRSKTVKTAICKALGYQIPKSFKKTQPRFPSQDFDVYTQKSLNVQIWNEDIRPSRRYVFLRISNKDIVIDVKVITGKELSKYDRTGRLTSKYQATMDKYGKNILFSKQDSQTIYEWISLDNEPLNDVNPNSKPTSKQLLPIDQIYYKLLPLVGQAVNYIDATQERNRSAELHKLICKNIGYSIFEDDGTYPDITNQLIEIKLQTSPTIDLGMHSPNDNEIILQVDDITFYSNDIRYVIFDATISKTKLLLENLYVVNGADFSKFFPIWKNKNSKIQLPLPRSFFDYENIRITNESNSSL